MGGFYSLFFPYQGVYGYQDTPHTLFTNTFCNINFLLYGYVEDRTKDNPYLFISLPDSRIEGIVQYLFP
jgi:hypothetical protein